MQIPIIVPLLVCLSLVPAVAAQSMSGVLPPRVAEHWGWKNRDYPMGRSWCRTQVRIDQAMFPGNLKLPAIVSSIGVRRSTGRTAFKAATIQQEIWFGSTKATNPSMATNFATNRANATSGTVVVPKRWINLPPAGFGSPRDFLMIPFQSPYVFNGPHLLVEFSNTAISQKLNGWKTDYVGTIGSGIRTYFGLPCAGGGVTSVSSAGGSGNYTLGSTINFWSGQAKPGVSTTHVLGLSPSNWGGIPLPLDFTPLGAPNCKLYVDALLMTGFTRDANGQVSRKLTIPNLVSLTNLSFYTQWANLDPAANSFGMNFAEATAITIGGPRITGINSFRLVSKDNNTSSTGEKFNNEMPVLKLVY
jgi:hypothetical protein